MKHVNDSDRTRKWLIIAILALLVCFACICFYVFGENTVNIPVENSIPNISEPVSIAEPEPTVTTLRFSASGDNLIHDGLYLQAQKRATDGGYDFKALYENIAPYFQNFDINWINQETLVTDELAPSSYPCFCSPEAVAKELYKIGFRVFSMSNNHSYDKGAIGIDATLRFWETMPDDVVYTGFYRGSDDYGNITLQEKDGVKIAYLAYTDSTNGIPLPVNAQANVVYTSQTDVIEAQIRQARTMADVVMTCVHWGTENSHSVNENQRILAQQMADWGADVVIGTHPHVVQPIEIITAAEGKSVPIFYSLGNFVSTQAQADNLIGIIASFDIVKTTQPDGSAQTIISGVHAEPIIMHYDTNYRNARVYLAKDYTDDIAATHGNNTITKNYIDTVIAENINPEFLNS